MNESENKLIQDIRLKEIITKLHCNVQEMSEFCEAQNKIFNMYICKTQKYLDRISRISQFLPDAHIKNYREFTIKKASARAKLWRQENDN
jgi:hypothetical protein